MGDNSGVSVLKFVMQRSLQSKLTDKGTHQVQPLSYEMGQYVFLNVPDVSLLEVHPFTISSSPLDPYASLHVKDMGRYTFTGRLYHHLQKVSNDPNGLANVVINVDGPYGIPFNYKEHSSILLVGGGIGITPLHSILRSLVLLHGSSSSKATGIPGILRRVRLVWGVRDIEMIDMFRDTFEKVLRCQDDDKKGAADATTVKFEISIHCSNRLTTTTATATTDSIESGKVPIGINTTTTTSSTRSTIATVHGRMQLDKEVLRLVGDPHAVVFVCGPEAMVKEAGDLTSTHNIQFHAETFIL